MTKRLSAVFAGAVLAVGLMAAPASASVPFVAPVAVTQAETNQTSVPGPLPKRLAPDEERKAQEQAQKKADLQLNAAAKKYGAKASVKGAPKKAGVSSSGSVNLLSGPYYFYNTRASSASPDIAGGSTTTGVKNPYLNTSDYHTLAELAVKKASTNDTVEVGWNVDRVVNGGSSNTHLFVFNWNAGTPGCYNACGWVDYAPNTLDAGDDISSLVGTTQWMEIQHFSGAWWIAFAGNWIGYFPDSDWAGSTFTSIDYTQIFGEVAAASATPCTDMGNGILGTSANTSTAAKLGSYQQVPNVGTNVLGTSYSTPSTIPTNVYESYDQSARTWVYGGPGWNSTGGTSSPAPVTGGC